MAYADSMLTQSHWAKMTGYFWVKALRRGKQSVDGAAHGSIYELMLLMLLTEMGPMLLGFKSPTFRYHKTLKLELSEG